MPRVSCLERPVSAVWLRLAHGTRIGWNQAVEEWTGRIAAGIVLLACSPLLALAILCGGRIQSDIVRGRGGRPVRQRILVNRHGRKFPLGGGLVRLWSVAAGDLAWIGPAPRGIDELAFRTDTGRRLSSVRPGLVCTWWIRSRTNVAYGTQTEADLDYVNARSMRTNTGILVRAAAALCYGRSSGSFPAEARILGLPVDNLTLDQSVDRIVEPRPSPLQVSFLNVDCVNKALEDHSYRETLRNSGLRLGDGIGLRIAGRMLKSEIRQNVNGTDLFPRLCARMKQDGLSLYLLGARRGAAEEVARWASSRFPGLRIVGTRDGYWKPSEEASVVAGVRRSGADILLVALGAPAQEKFIAGHLNEFGVRAALGVGGLFDFYSGRIRRAPQWLRDIGMEWVYRLCQEPGRMWRRYLVGNFVFLARVAFAAAKSTRAAA